jgi:hypothetical protein
MTDHQEVIIEVNVNPGAALDATTELVAAAATTTTTTAVTNDTAITVTIDTPATTTSGSSEAKAEGTTVTPADAPKPVMESAGPIDEYDELTQANDLPEKYVCIYVTINLSSTCDYN